MSELHTCKEVAKRYGVKVITVWDWIRKKVAINVGKKISVGVAEFIEALIAIIETGISVNPLA